MARHKRRFELAALVPRLLVAAALGKAWSERTLRDVRSMLLPLAANQ